MKTNNVKESSKAAKQPEIKKSSGNSTQASEKNSRAAATKTDSSNKGKGPKGENL